MSMFKVFGALGLAVVLSYVFSRLFVWGLLGVCKLKEKRDTGRQLTRWKKLYREEFGITLGDVSLPKRKPGFDRLIIVAKDATLKQVLAVINKHFATYSCYGDLDIAVTKNERTNETMTYAIWARDCIEADEENAGKSANDIKSTEVATMTLLERLLYELIFFIETGNHLDVWNITLCAGSRDLRGDVPEVNWCKDELGIYSCYPHEFYFKVRARAVSSFAQA